MIQCEPLSVAALCDIFNQLKCLYIWKWKLDFLLLHITK